MYRYFNEKGKERIDGDEESGEEGFGEGDDSKDQESEEIKENREANRNYL